MDNQKPEFKQTGAVVRLKFSNFMQYRDTEFLPGPNLNVIIGPNGSGKSTIVNGICIGLAGKLSVLGRATNLADFVSVGEETAMVEIELHNSNSKNHVIQRTFNTKGKSDWRIDGKKSTEKEVKELASKLRIQVDNLCQFLPQDKVGDFARLNNKGLLDSTIDAVGNTGLKEMHAELKELQQSLNEGDNVHQRKLQMLQEKTDERDKLEDEVKAFEEKRQLVERIDMLSKRRVWAVFDEARRECAKFKRDYEESKKLVGEKEEPIAPLTKEVANLNKQLEKMTKAQEKEAATLKESVGKAKVHSQQIESLERDLEGHQEKAFDISRQEKEKAASIEQYEKTIRELERAINEMGDNTNLDAQMQNAKTKTQELIAKLEVEKQKKIDFGYELKAKANEKERVSNQMQQLQSVDNRKLEVLQKYSPHAYQAVKWLRNNRENFRGKVYEPFILSCNVVNPDNAIYIENTVSQRDQTVFFFEDADDMNNFLNNVRTVQKLERVGAVHIADTDPSNLVSRVPADRLANYGLVSYVKDMVQAPGPVLAYMCQQYNLHNTPVFHPNAEKHSDVITNEFGMRVFFFGHKRQTVSRSSYSGKTSTMTQDVRAFGTLGAGLDQEKLDQLNQQIELCKQDMKDIEARIKSTELDCQQLSVELEARKMEQRKLEQTNMHIAKLRTNIQTKQRRLREISTKNFEADKAALRAACSEVIGKMVRSVGLLKKAVETNCKVQIQKELKTLQSIPIRKSLNEKRRTIETLREEISEFREKMEEHARAFEESRKIMSEAHKEAKTETNGTSAKEKQLAPEKYTEYWEKANFPCSLTEIDLLHGELEAKASCTDNVQEGVVEKYRELKDQVNELEKDVLRRDKMKQTTSKRIEKLKNDWLGALDDLISRINVRFAKYFDLMGFAGAVELHTGKHETDFDNYGIKILVKYRDTEPLKELCSSYQSGGEKSVATAIYMLALQNLTTVPFRVVDEINQGMDARNEKLIYDLVVETSCEENNAQYFLLTPKLMTGLEYSPRMSVLIVHSGQHMLNHAEWNLNDIYANLRGE